WHQEEPKLPVSQIDFSPDGRRVLVVQSRPGPFKPAPDVGFARVWDRDSGQPLTPRLELAGGVLGAWFSKDGRRVVTLGFDNRALRFWAAARGHPLPPAVEMEDTIYLFPPTQVITPRVPNYTRQPDTHLFVRIDVVGRKASRGIRLWDLVTDKPLTDTLRPGGVIERGLYAAQKQLLVLWTNTDGD